MTIAPASFARARSSGAPSSGVNNANATTGRLSTSRPESDTMISPCAHARRRRSIHAPATAVISSRIGGSRNDARK
jgi:hypothetical protein